MPQDNSQFDLRILWSKPLAEINIDVKLRRKLINAGFKTLGEAFDCSDKELDRLVGIDVTDEIIALSEAYDRNPQATTKKLTIKDMPKAESLLSIEKPSPSVPPVTRIPAVSKPKTTLPRPHSAKLPYCKESDELREFEKMARKALGVVEDHAEDAFIAEALGMVSTHIPSLRKNIKRIFELKRKSSESGSSLGAVRALTSETPDSFLLYMLDSAQRNFDGSSVWRRSFAELGITDTTSEQEIPRFLYGRIADKGFRIYSEDETGFQYYYTILLHAGLAESDWASIWSRLILPLAEDMRKGRYPDGAYPTSDMLIQLANDNDGRYYLANRSASNLIAKAPEVAGPLLSSALLVAETMLSSSMEGTEPVLMSSGLLPNLAMDALLSTLEPREKKPGHRKSSPGIVYFPPAELRLNPADGDRPVCIHWNSSRLPDEYAGRTVAYRVNGETLMKTQIKRAFDSAILEETSVRLAPAKSYDVEVELSTSGSSIRGRLCSAQSFRENRPGIYEFVRTSDGVLRQKMRPLRRKRDVHCLVAPGYSIIPGSGMELLNRELIGDGYSIQVFEMDQMGCGEILDPNGEQASAWCEGFKVSLDASRAIGEGSSGCDLFPFLGAENDGAYNWAMPSIAIESLEEGFDHRQLKVECSCDGRSVAVKRLTVENAGMGSTVMLRLDQSIIPAFVNLGRIRVTHMEKGRTILAYRFSVAPIGRISLESAWLLDDGTAMASYAVIASKACEIRRNSGSMQAFRSTPRYIDAPLSDEWLSVTVAPVGEDPDPEVSANIFLAGIGVKPPAVTRVDQEAFPDRLDLQEMPADSGSVMIECRGRRANRGAYLSLGATPKFYKMLPIASRYLVMPFSPLPEAGQDDGAIPADLTLMLSYECGLRERLTQANCRLDLGRVLLGYGFGGCELATESERSALRLSNPLGYDLSARFIRERGGKEKVLCDDVEIPAGTTVIPLPKEAREQLVRRNEITIVFAADDLFGDADFSQGHRIRITR